MTDSGARLYLAYGTSADEVEFRGLWSDHEVAVAEARKTRFALAFVAAVRIDERRRRPVEIMSLMGVMVGFRERTRDLLSRITGGPGCGLGPMVALDPNDEELEEWNRV
jgi:hypothetical protein